VRRDGGRYRAALLDIVKVEAAALRTCVATLHGQFGDGPDGAMFDAILFFEAFHHALDHLGLLARLRDRLAPNGRVIFAGEPIMEAGDYWAPTLPHAWGPRLSARSDARRHGRQTRSSQPLLAASLLCSVGQSGSGVSVPSGSSAWMAVNRVSNSPNNASGGWPK
jgi:hypothetical protein